MSRLIWVVSLIFFAPSAVALGPQPVTATFTVKRGQAFGAELTLLQYELDFDQNVREIDLSSYYWFSF